MYGICNVVGASIPRNTDSGTYIHVGPEIGVASTKAFTGQVTVLMLLALCVGQMRGTVDDATVERIVRELKNMPLYIKDVLGLADKIKNLSKIYTYARNFLYLGRGYNYPTALEGALKLKEISYIHAEGYPAAEMKLYIPAETPLFFPAQTKYKADMAHHCTQRTVMLAHDMKTLFQRSFVVAGSHPLAQVINQHEMSIMQ